MASETIDLLSPYRPEECARRLRMVTDPGRRHRNSNPLIGVITDTTLRLRRRLAYRNSFQTFLFATMEGEEKGTRLRCRFGMRVGLTVAFDLFGIDHGIDRPLWPAAVVPVLMAVFALFWLKFSRRLADEDELFMIELFRFSLDAELTPESAARRAAEQPR
jgi:hypothetical protein